MYVQMLGMLQSFFGQQPHTNFGQFQGMLSYQQIAFSITLTAATTPVQPSNNSSNKRISSSFNPWDPYIKHEQSTKLFLLLHICIFIFTIGSIVLNRFIKTTAFLNAISSTVCCSHVLIINPNPGSGRGTPMFMNIFLQ